jgi:small conductance mechanosensitive channel
MVNTELITQKFAQLAADATFALLILLFGFWFAGVLKRQVSKLLARRSFDPMLTTFLGSLLHILAILIVIIAALSQLGIQTSSLVAVLGAAGLAIGLALQGSLSNFAAGVMIITFRPFKVGDYIEIGAVGGHVEGIQIFYTQLRTGDNKVVIVPNSAVTNGTITNYTARDTRRVDMEFAISYKDDVARAKHILMEVLKSDARILKDPAPVVAVGRLADSAVQLIARPWARTDQYWEVFWHVTEQVKSRFEAAGITIPFPQREMHVYQHGPFSGG